MGDYTSEANLPETVSQSSGQMFCNTNGSTNIVALMTTLQNLQLGK